MKTFLPFVILLFVILRASGNEAKNLCFTKNNDTLKFRKNNISLTYGNQFNFRKYATSFNDGMPDFKIFEKPSALVRLDYKRLLGRKFGAIGAIDIVNSYFSFKKNFFGEFENIKELYYKAGYLAGTAGIFFNQKFNQNINSFIKIGLSHYSCIGQYYEFVSQDNIIYERGKSYNAFNNNFTTLNANMEIDFKLVSNVYFGFDIGIKRIISGSFSRLVKEETIGLNVNGGIVYEW